MRGFLKLFILDTSDGELMRAQFSSFSRHIPLLYVILVINTVAIVVTSFQSDHLFKTLIAPALISGFALTRAYWWSRQTEPDRLTDGQISAYLKRTCILAVIQTLAFTLWVIWIYQDADVVARSNLTFFLALSQVSTVFCLMTLRVAAMLVAVVSTGSFALYFSWVDDAQLLPQALVLCCVCAGMAIVTHGFNRSFYELVRSRRKLHERQLETEKLSEENRRIAFTDALTGLPNRRELLARLDRLKDEEPLRRDSLAVVFIDLDAFKDVNDEHGHQAGDALIASVCQRLLEQCPANAVLARVGGDEFTVLIEAEGAEESAQVQASALASTLLEEIAVPIVVDRHVLQVGGSIGIAVNLDAACNPRELLRRADLAMYYAKTQGKGQIAYYDEELDEGRLRRLEVEAQIGNGLKRSEFAVAYQPIVESEEERTVAVEALLRWPNRPRGPLHPNEFIEIAEATGQIHPLGLYVLERSCRELSGLEDLRLSVNVSPAQFRHPQFEEQVLGILNKTGFPPERLQLEITESYLLSNPARVLQAVATLKEKGIKLALDDFGTGFTSIHYLQSYGFDHIKIDKSLVTGLEPGNKATQLVTGAITMASALDIEVTAEGVETAKQARLLRKAGCHTMQGYHFGRPMPLDRFTAHFRHNGK
ncbi:MAG: EAL domain-containing protein, partial [Pseudomonadota bacterium]|nr:EAL domain-containing protein [Pseudomonadota bacterium]